MRAGEELPAVPPAWSRRVRAAGHAWHVLDNAPAVDGEPRGTVLAVHGNPTWSFLWRHVLHAGAAAGWRVVAVDQLGMGLSDRAPARRLARRVADLGALTDVLGLSGSHWDGRPVVTLGHDWGGIVSAGWAVDHPRELAGLVLTNTAVHHPPDRPIPAALRLARLPGVQETSTVRTRAFLETTLSLSDLDPEVRRAYRAPYRDAASRQAIGDFVEDIPATPDHPSHEALEEVAEGLRGLSVPALLLWGPRDPVFHELHLRDLLTRLPRAAVHRFEGAGHLLPEDADVAGAVVRWLERAVEGRRPAEPLAQEQNPRAPYRPVWQALAELGEPGAPTASRPAVVALSGHGAASLTWGELAMRVLQLAHGLTVAGVRPGHRVALLIPPGVDLTTALYACLRIGAVVVLADAGLGVRGLTRAVRGADPDHVIGIGRALAAARALRWPGRRILVGDPHEGPRAQDRRRRALGADGTFAELLAYGAGIDATAHPEAEHLPPLPPAPGPEDDAAILFTSGSTGPAKGVVHTHRGLAGMRDAVAAVAGLSPERSFVAGFAPFALLGTATGATSATPDMDVTAPATLTAPALAEAAAAVDAHAVFASPSALANVVRTAGGLDDAGRTALARVRVFLSAGAPISSERLARAKEIMPAASVHTPYGMTEALPVTDVSLEEIRAAEDEAARGAVAGAGGGTCVGTPVPGARILIVPLDAGGEAGGRPTTEPGVTGEILVSAPNLKDRYDRLWLTEDHSATWPAWHRTGDVGHLDGAGRLWVEGRLAHILRTADGVLTPVGLENAVLALPGLSRAAAVGVGPAGAQQVVIVVETDPAFHRGAAAPAGLAPEGLSRAVRSACAPVPVAAVLRVPEIPTDVRHNAKVERARVAAWAERLLAGERAGRP